MAATDRKYFWREGDPLWFKDAVIYELHVRAFADSDGDGIGDFAGLTQRLDYLQDLGVDTIWLLPFYPSPLKDDGYDISDYTNIHPAYGTLEDFKNFMKKANQRGLRVVTELVLNHTSDQHPWFQRARRAPPGSQWRDFYVWSDTQEKYRGTRVIFKDFELSNWTWDPVAKAYFWHRFYSHQPDLNFDNPLVQQAVMKVMDFWLGMGVSGLRLDAVPYLYEREGTNCENLPETHVFLRELRRHIDDNFRNRMTLAEANQWAEDAVAYFGKGDECHMAYHFPLMPRMFMSIRMEDRFPIIDIIQNSPRIPETSQWALFLRNHDELTLEMVTDEERDYMYRVYAQDVQARINLGIRRRLAPLLNNDRRKIELMTGLLFSLPGTPVIYYGDEIGMGDNFYLGDRNGVRTPMQWSSDRNAGFSRANPQRLYLPVVSDPEYHYEAVNVETQQSNSDSFLWWMKRLLSLRKRFKAFGRGTLDFLQPENRKVLSFVRRFENETILVVANLSRQAQYCTLDFKEFNGMTPVEVFGQTEFPPIGDTPYSFTLGPYAWYWFSLEARKALPADRALVLSREAVPAMSVQGEWSSLFRRTGKSPLEPVLLGYVKQRRWFGGKARKTRTTQIDDVIAIPYGTASAQLVFLRIEYTDGEPDIYLVPIAFASDEEAVQIESQSPQAVIARLTLIGRNGEKEGILYDAVFKNEFNDFLLKVLEQGNTLKGEKGEAVAFRINSVFKKARETKKKEVLGSRLIKGEQSNTSIIFGDKFKLKLLRRLEDGISPELEIGRFLTEKEALPNISRVCGAIEYLTRRQGQNEPMTLAILHEFVSNQGDAWDYTLESLKLYFEQVLARRGEKVPLPVNTSLLDICNEELPAIIKETAGPYLASTQLLAQRTAELHLALASAVDEPGLVPEPYSVHYQRSLYHGTRTFVLQVLQLLRQNLKKLPEPVKLDAQTVLDMESDIIERLREVTKHRISGMRVRCHGDYHLGQVLYTGTDFVIVDFEGEPARHLGERRIKRSPLRDVAGMVRSFHYAAFAALREQTFSRLRPGDMAVLENWANAWYLWVSGTFLKSYLEFMADTPILPQARGGIDVILDVHLLDKVVYEINYELNNRPDWIGIALKGLLQVLESRRPVEEAPPPAKKSQLTLCPVCHTEFYVVAPAGEAPPVVNVTCPNCKSALEVDFA